MKCCSDHELAISSTAVEWRCEGIGSECNLMSGWSTFEAGTTVGRMEESVLIARKRCLRKVMLRKSCPPATMLS